MSVASQTPYNVQAGDGASTSFPYPFQILAAADLAVYVDSALKVLNADYTVTGAGNLTGGSVVFTTPPGNTTKVTLTRAMVKQRTTDYQQAGDFLTSVVNPDFDRSILMIQELNAALNRGIRVAPYELSSNMQLPSKSARASSYLYFDVNGDASVAAALASGTLSQSSIGGFLTPQTPAELAAGVTPVKTWYAEGDVRRYGAFLDGVIDDTIALQNWANVGGALSFPVAQTAKVTNTINLPSNTTVTGCGGSTVKMTVADKSIFAATNKTKVKVRGIHFQQTTWGAAAYVGQVIFDTCTYCDASDNEFEGTQWVGVYLRATQHSTVRSNYIHDSFPLQALTFTAAPLAGATSATLNAAWTLATGSYVVALVETVGGVVEGKAVTLTNGATTATWSGGLAQNCNAAITVYPDIDSCDIYCGSSNTAGSHYNVIEGNFCYGNTLEVGIICQDPYSGFLSTRNVISKNRVTAHPAYGIICYMPTAGDSWNTIVDNFIENANGNYPLNQSSGAGIYGVGAGLGGLVVKGNTVRNCCIGTTLLSLSPAGISIAGTAAGTVPVVVSGNSVSDMTQYHGIYVSVCAGGVSVSGNTVRHPAANSTGDPIRVQNSNNVAITGNSLTQLNLANNTTCIFIYANGAANTNLTITGNTLNGGNLAQIRLAQTGGFQTDGITIQANNLNGGTANCVALLLDNTAAANVLFSGNYLFGTVSPQVSITACTNVRCSGNRVRGAANPVLTTSGVCTGGLWDRSNAGVGAAGINNGGTGFRVELEGTAAPASGTWAVGDIQYNTTPTAAGVLLWVCTGPGTGGGTAVFKTVSNT